jgi:tight adherence protein C
MAMNSLTVQCCAFLAVSALTFLAFRAIWARDRRLHDRISELSTDGASLARISTQRVDSASQASLRSKLSQIARNLLPDDTRERTQLKARLLQAGIYAEWAPGLFLTAKLALITLPPFVAVGLAALGLVNPNRGLLYGAVAGGTGLILPGLWLSRSRTRRHTLLLKSLPDFLDLLVTCVQAGLSLPAALQRVTDDLAVAHPVLAGEMGLVLRQIELGASPDLALRNFAERSDLAAIASLSSLIEQARRFGTSVCQALRTYAEAIREQREHQAEEVAQKAAVKILFPTLLFIFPAIFVVLVGPAAVQISESFAPRVSDQATQAEAK